MARPSTRARKASAKEDSQSSGARDQRDDGVGGSRGRRAGWWCGLVVLSVAILWMLLIYPAAPIVLFVGAIDLIVVAALLLCATALGAAVLDWLQVLALPPLPRPLALVVSAALGVGTFSLLLLLLGLLGLLSWPVLLALPAGALVVGGRSLGRLWRNSPPLPRERAVSSRWSWAGLVLVPVVFVSLAAVNIPPGVLWTGALPSPPPERPGPAGPHPADVYREFEGRGYDALEYHLQVPREYLAQGRIRFLPHNVYASFPLNAEMWFMLLMGLDDRPQTAVYRVQILNLLLAVLAVAAVYVAGRIGRGETAGGGNIAAVAVAAVPMLAFVSVVAYVEPMLMLFVAASWAMLRYYKFAADEPPEAAPAGPAASGSRPLSPSPNRPADAHPDAGATSPAAAVRVVAHPPLAAYALVIGLLLGLAAGTKLTAIPMFIAPLAVGLLIARGLTRLPLGNKLNHAMLIVVGLLVTLSPWLVRTSWQSGGNPVFPLMWNTFGGGDWTASEAQRWDKTHLPDVPAGERVGRAVWRFASHPSLTLLTTGGSARSAMFNASLYGPWLWLLCWPIFFVRGRNRWDALLLATALGQFAFWIVFTDMVSRFILPAIVPLGLLVGRSAGAFRPALRGAMVMVLVSFAAVSGMQLIERFRTDAGGGDLAAAGQLFRSGEQLFETGVEDVPSPSAFLNRRLEQLGVSADGPPAVWLVGDATPFYIHYPVQYNVAFSRNWLAELIASRPPEQARDWLRERGFRLLFVDWSEVARLRETYGFAESIRPETLRRLGQVEPVDELADRVGQPSNYWLIHLDRPPGEVAQSGRP